MAKTEYARLSQALVDLLGLGVPPIAIAFLSAVPANVPRLDGPMPPPTGDGRTGAAAASCVFWMMATGRAFTTVAADHGNCSVGGLTHGFKTLAEAAKGADIAGLVKADWVAAQAFPAITTISRKPGAVVYSPLATTLLDPDVVFLRLNGKQLMKVHAAYPNLRFEGKPQCHIVAIAKETGVPAASTGCALSRERTGMPDSEVTFAIPGHRLAEFIERLKAVQAADLRVAAYARKDATRFPSRI
jgi:uncharacterized protein (DUF169 family)